MDGKDDLELRSAIIYGVFIFRKLARFVIRGDLDTTRFTTTTLVFTALPTIIL